MTKTLNVKKVRLALRNYQKARVDYAKELGITVQTLRSPAKLERVVRYNEIMTRFLDNSPNRDTRISNWSNWSKKGQTLPYELDLMAREINMSTKKKQGDLTYKRYDEFDSYGYAVVYFAYIQNKPISMVLREIQGDKFDGNLYRFMKKSA